MFSFGSSYQTIYCQTGSYQTNSFSDTNTATTNSLQISQVQFSSSSPVFWCHLSPDPLQPILQTPRGLRSCPRAAHPMQGPGTLCSTPKSTEQWCAGTKTHPKHPKLHCDSFSCSYLNPLGKLCVQDPKSLYHINVYLACPKVRAIMVRHKSETTYNSTRHRGKSRPPYHTLKRETSWFVSKIGEKVIFLTAPRAPQTLAAQKKKQQISQNRTAPCTCASYSQWNFIHSVPQK